MSKNEKDLKKGDVVDLFPEKTVQSKIRARESRKVNQDPVHQPNTKLKVLDDKGWYDKDKGISEAGADVRYYKRHKDEQATEKAYGGGAYGIHRRVLAALKKQPKPNLTRSESEDMSKSKLTKADIEKFDQELKKARVPNAKQHSGHGDREHGVHQDLTWDKGMSQMGNQARAGVTGSAKISSKVNLAELKNMPKPNLPKDKVEKAADPLANQLTPEKGVSDVGIEIRRADKRNPGVVSHGYGRVSSPEKHKDIAVGQLKRLVDHIKSQPKPNLTKLELDKTSDHEKGVHQASYSTQYIKNGKTMHGISHAGIKAREAHEPSSFEEYDRSPKAAKEIHKEKLTELKNMPKPNLTKTKDDEHIQEAKTLENKHESELTSSDKKRLVELGHIIDDKKRQPKPNLTKAKVDEGKSKEDKQKARSERHTVFNAKEFDSEAPDKNKGTGAGVTRPDDKGVHAVYAKTPKRLKERHQAKLDILKEMPKPNLPKENMDKADTIKDGRSTNQSRHIKFKNESAINKPYASGAGGVGISGQGYTVRGGMAAGLHDQTFRHKDSKGPYDRDLARTKAKDVLTQIKNQPKPKLTRSDIEAFDQKLTKARVDEGKSPEIKAADRAQRHPINISSEGKKVGINQPGTKGVHAPGSEKPGISLAGEKIRVPKVPGGGFKDMSRKKAVVIAKDIHKQKLSELKAMPKPNLTASEGMSKAADPKDGGTLNYKQIKKDFINKKNSMQNAPKQAPAEPTNIKPHAPTNQNYGKLHDPQMSGTVNYKNPIKKADACGSLKRLAGSLKKVDPKTHLPGNLFEKSEKKDET
jgi:hypothetical protein